MTPEQPPMLGFAAYSGTGKTTLLKHIIHSLTGAGLVVSVIKHAHHQFDIDYPGKDSYELRKAGARQMLVSSDQRRALISELPVAEEPEIHRLRGLLDTRDVDLVIVEGFRDQAFPKIELHRPAMERPPMYPNDPHIVAVASDAPLPVATHLPVLDLNDTVAITEFIKTWRIDDTRQNPETCQP